MRAVAAVLGLAAATACAADAPAAPPPAPTTAAPPATDPVPSTVPATAPAPAAPPAVHPLPRAGRGAARTSTSVAPATTAPPVGNEGAMEQQAARLACIRRYESGGDYGAVSASGKFRGAYQFDQRTWESNSGEGDPAAASPAEQDRVAAVLLERRGLAPWPTPARRCA